jgi:2-succinyl-6-hydroxy-2,4-cyclohexadiene-1-carboxylate synthase
MTRIAVNGLHLNVEDSGEGPPLLLLHGFTGSAATWRPFAEAFAGFRRIAVDLIGHGGSDAPADERRYAMERCIDDLTAVLDALGIERAHVVGYSMGGRVALHLAAAHPERMALLTLESTSPGIADPEERRLRAAQDRALADDIEREGVAAFVERWEALPMWASLSRLPPDVRSRQREQRLRNSARGLANSLRGMGAGAQTPLHERLGEIARPALLLAGRLDAKYAAMAREMAARLPDARVTIVPDAGHAVHLERPHEFARAARDFLTARTEERREREHVIGH